MPRVARTRLVPAPPDEVWRLISDPHHLPRWWPRTSRVEDVQEGKGGRRTRWTQVLETRSGSTVRADYRSVGGAESRSCAWEQELADTPFERILRRSRIEVHLAPADGGTEVTIEIDQALRGLSRLGGGAMMRRAHRRTLDDALAGLDQALGADEA